MKNLINQIRKIDNTADLNAIVAAIKVQQKIVRTLVTAEKKLVLSVGMDVIINGKKIKKGVITIMKVKRAIVKCRNTQGEAVLWDCPLTMLEAA